MRLNTTTTAILIASLASTSALAADNTDTSSVSAGIGFDNYGASVKVQFDDQSEASQTKGIVEIKGIAGDSLGWAGSSDRDNSIDSVRARYFNTDNASHFGTYFDTEYDVASEKLDLSANVTWQYQYKRFEILPYAGVGLTVLNGELPLEEYGYPVDDHVTGYTLPGTYGQVGAYAKVALLDNLDFMYNPEWRSTLSGAAGYTNHYYKGKDSQFTNELRLTYQITTNLDVQYHEKWDSEQNYSDATRGFEFNYKF
ncbi:hypothetical protein BCU70_09455 [Vibrio sp. 10N.286.49.C2]|uniref:hypothetical protein n=1 Tax=unclassified Vibrio TaxID=2614977 RepID=UPI000C83FFDC|nr:MULTISPECIES: hypothetical protein [unclassified Vibrio]PMH26379.1 hypothetical protein BCU70_09455 [Vibrio sp. 10N.286.49.C2]PMH54897.1 hypothetical protein BCU66_11480 [Vibrio sp. 10N.286.49.B1]PMH79976.1 hypothetical protein BCU58_24430 [Vibrio sp. 10N.286.48.B7]